MKFFIIGNGFDRGHDLPTSYLDFRTYLDNEDWQFLMSVEETYAIYEPDLSAPYYPVDAHIQGRNDLLWNQLETNLANIDLDNIIENAIRKDLGLEDEYGIIDALDAHHARTYQYIDLQLRIKSLVNKQAKVVLLEISNPF